MGTLNDLTPRQLDDEEKRLTGEIHKLTRERGYVRKRMGVLIKLGWGARQWWNRDERRRRWQTLLDQGE